MSEIAFIVRDATGENGEALCEYELRVNNDQQGYDPESPASCVGAYLSAFANSGQLGVMALQVSQKYHEAKRKAEEEKTIVESSAKVIGIDGKPLSAEAANET